MDGGIASFDHPALKFFVSKFGDLVDLSTTVGCNRDKSVSFQAAHRHVNLADVHRRPRRSEKTVMELLEGVPVNRASGEKGQEEKTHNCYLPNRYAVRQVISPLFAVNLVKRPRCDHKR